MALWERAFDKAEAISSREIEADENFSAGYWKSGMSERSAAGTGGKKPAFRASHLASGVVAGPWGVVRVGMEGGVEEGNSLN